MELLDLSTRLLDPIVILLVLFSGLFQKKYLADVNISGTWKTLLVSIIFTVIYAFLVHVAGNYSKELPVKWFFSYVCATSLYELLLKKFVAKYFPDAAKMIIIVFAVGSLSSCSAVKTKERAHLVTSTNIHAVTKDSGAYSVKSAVSTLQADSIISRLYGYKAGSSLNILFAGSPDTTSTPVIVEQLHNKTIIHAGARQIAAVTIANDSAATTRDSIALKKNTITVTAHADSAFIKFSDKATAGFTDEQTEFIKKTKPAAYVLFCLLGVAFLILAGGILYVMRKNDEIKAKL